MNAVQKIKESIREIETEIKRIEAGGDSDFSIDRLMGERGGLQLALHHIQESEQ